MLRLTGPAVVKALSAAREKVAAGWCKRAWARDVDGNPVEENDPQACCWCLGGALALEEDADAREGAVGAVYEALRLAVPAHWVSVSSWNDCTERTQEDVLSLLDRALTYARCEG